MHRVVALALPDVVAFDLAIPAQIFGRWPSPAPYSFEVCAPQPGSVPTTTGYAVQVSHGLEALREADTVVVPGYVPNDRPPEDVCAALRAAAERGARVMSVCTAPSPSPRPASSTGGAPRPTGERPGSWPRPIPRSTSTPTCSTSTAVRC